MKILITGSNGMLAKAVIEQFKSEDILCLDKEKLDITDKNMVEDKVSSFKPEYIINCAAYTNVNEAERDAKLAIKVNYEGVKNLSDVSKKYNITLIHISTDYVFEGTLDIKYEYKEEDIANPKTVYGMTKLKGEKYITENLKKFYIFRTAWLYGDGKNFVKTIINLGKEKNSINVVNDQYGSPTFTKDLAEIIDKAIKYKIPYGIYHATNEGTTTWCEFAKKILKLANVKCEVIGVTTEEYEKIAKRPKNSKLSKNKLKMYNIYPRNYEEALFEYIRGNNI